MKGPIRRTKVVLRHLPPTISQSSLTEQIDGRFAGLYNWISFRHGNNNRKKHPSYSREYIDFKRPEDVAEFAKFFDGHICVNEKGVSDTIVLNMSTLVWSVVTTVQSSSPLACEGLSLVLGTYRGLHMLVSFGGYKYDGQYSNEVNVLKPSYKIEPLQPQVVTEEAAFPVDCRIKPRRRWKQDPYASSGSSSPDCT